MIVQQVVHRTCESRKQVTADKAVMKWCVQQCAAMFVQYKHKRHRAISAADTVAWLFKTKFSANDGWHDITNRSKCGEAPSAHAKEMDPFTNKLPTDPPSSSAPSVGFNVLLQFPVII